MGKTLWQRLSDHALEMRRQALADVRTLDDWTRLRGLRHAEFMQDLGLHPLPARCDIKLTDHGRFTGPGYSARRIRFQLLPDCWTTANLYYPDPLPADPAPAVVYVCGHGSIGVHHYQYHPIMWARRGYVCLLLDTVEQHDNRGEHHGSFTGRLDHWLALGYTPAGAEVWNAMRGADLLVADPRVNPRRIGITGVSGGGACSFHAACADERFTAVSTLCGISSPLDAIVNRHVDGHCDCMYPHNLFARDISEYAALIAPRAGLFCFTEQDSLYCVDENRAMVNKARRVWQLSGAEDRCRTMTCPGPHGDHPTLDEATAAWFDEHLAGGPRPAVKRGPRELAEPVTSVLGGEHVAGDRLHLLPELLSPRGSVALPADADQWPRQRDKIVAALLAAAPSLRPGQAAGRFTEVGSWRWPAQTTLKAWRGDIEGQDVWLRCAVPPGDSDALLISVAGEGETVMHAIARIADANDSSPIAYGGFEPRMAGHNSLPPANPHVPVGSQPMPVRTSSVRAMALTGTTPVATTVQDLGVLMGAIETIPDLRGRRLFLLGCGDAAVAVLYHALLDSRVAGVVLADLPSSHTDGAPILGVLRALDIPEALGLLAPRRVALVRQGHQYWTWPMRAFERLGCPANLNMARDLRAAITHVLG